MAEALTLELAEQVIAAAKKKSQDLGVKEDIAVVDAGGNLKAFARMDGAWLGSIDIAIRKARPPAISIWRRLRSASCLSRASRFMELKSAMED